MSGDGNSVALFTGRSQIVMIAYGYLAKMEISGNAKANCVLSLTLLWVICSIFLKMVACLRMARKYIQKTITTGAFRTHCPVDVLPACR